MAENTGERPASLAHAKIIAEAKRLEESTLYSMKGHHCAARGWAKRGYRLGIPTLVISLVVSGAVFVQAAKDVWWLGIIAAIASTLVSVLTALTTFLKPNDKENEHLNAAHAYDKLNNDARFFHSIVCWQGCPDETLTETLRALIEEKNRLNKESLQIPDWAYAEAKKGIEAGEAEFKVDREPTPPAPVPQIEAPKEHSRGEIIVGRGHAPKPEATHIPPGWRQRSWRDQRDS